METIGLRQHSLKTKADFIKYELKKHNMAERRPMTVSPPGIGLTLLNEGVVAW